MIGYGSYFSCRIFFCISLRDVNSFSLFCLYLESLDFKFLIVFCFIIRSFRISFVFFCFLFRVFCRLFVIYFFCLILYVSNLIKKEIKEYKIVLFMSLKWAYE